MRPVQFRCGGRWPEALVACDGAGRCRWPPRAGARVGHSVLPPNFLLHLIFILLPRALSHDSNPLSDSESSDSIGKVFPLHRPRPILQPSIRPRPDKPNQPTLPPPTPRTLLCRGAASEAAVVAAAAGAADRGFPGKATKSTAGPQKPFLFVTPRPTPATFLSLPLCPPHQLTRCFRNTLSSPPAP